MELNTSLVMSFVRLKIKFGNAVGIRGVTITSLKGCDNARGLWERFEMAILTFCVYGR